MIRQVRRLVYLVKLFRNRNKLRQKGSHHHFFIVGSGRCGSTLLKVILEKHSEIVIVPEIGDALWKAGTRMMGRHQNMVNDIANRFTSNRDWINWEIPEDHMTRYVEENPASSDILRNIYYIYKNQHKASATLVGDKNPFLTFDLPLIKALFPKAKVIHLVRNGFDVVHSWNSSKGLEMTVEDAAKRWNWSLKEIERFSFLFGSNFITIRYEDLVSDPGAVVDRILKFLNLSPEDSMLDHGGNSHTGELKKAHHAKATKPVDKKSIGKGLKNLSSQEISQIAPIMMPRIRKYGYE